MSVSKYPNIAISGNPGVGKTALAKRLVEAVENLNYLDFGKDAVSRGFHDGWDDELGCHIVDFEAMAEDLEGSLGEGGYVIDWIHADFWPLDGLINLVVTITCDNTTLFDRYQERGYDQAKIDENIDSEIMEEIVEENKGYYEGEESSNLTTLVKLKGETDEDMKQNLALLVAWIEKWQKRHHINGQKDGEALEEGDATGSLIRRVSIDQPPS